MGFCSLCLYLKQPYSQHWCKEYFGRNKLFCEKCVVHVSICNSPSTHEKTCLPYSVAEKGNEDTAEPDETEEETDDVVRAHCVTLEDFGHTEDDYDYENHNGYDEDW